MAVLALFVAVSFSLGFATHIIEPGKWFQNHAVYQQQVEAFLRGEFALGRNPSDLKMDLAWHDGRVQQVWGLGAPLLLLPTYLLSKLFPAGVFFRNEPSFCCCWPDWAMDYSRHCGGQRPAILRSAPG